MTIPTTADDATEPAGSTDRGETQVRRGGRRSVAGYVVMPAIVVTAVVAMFVYIHSRPLNSVEQTRLLTSDILTNTVQHIKLTAVSTALVLLIAVPLGIVLTRRWARLVAPPAIAVFSIGQAVPSVGLVVLLAIVWDIGFQPMIVALVAYTVVPVLRNTMVGLRQVDTSVIESARGMGMTKLAVLVKIELPLAVPIIMAGLRTALTINVGTAALAPFIGAGGLGELIITGLDQSQNRILIVGAVLVAALALLVDYLAGLAEDFLRPKGL